MQLNNKSVEILQNVNISNYTVVTSDMMSCTSECGPGDVTYLGRVCMSSVNGTFDFSSEV